MKKDYGRSAQQLVDAMGGKKNITRVFHCMTRLRFYVNDKNMINEEEIKKLSEVSGVNWHQDQFQVIAGNEVNEIYAELVKMGIPNDDTDTSQKSSEKKSVGSAIIDSITGCMTPMIPALTAAGMIKVVLTLLTTFNLVSDQSSTYQVISFIGDAAYYFMPFLIAANAAKVFRVNESLALIIAGVFLHPSFTAMIESGDPITLFSIPVTPTSYSYSVIPIILMVWIMSYIVKLVDRITPRIVKLILHPTLVILISAPIAIIIVGPLGGIIGDWLAVAIDFLSAKLGFIIVGILAAAFPFIVMTGMHHALTPIGLNAIATGGDTLVFVSQVCSNVAQGGASLAVAVKSKDKDWVETRFPADNEQGYETRKWEGYHVAMAIDLPIYQASTKTERLIFDPVVFNEVVREKDWVSALNTSEEYVAYSGCKFGKEGLTDESFYGGSGYWLDKNPKIDLDKHAQIHLKQIDTGTPKQKLLNSPLSILARREIRQSLSPNSLRQAKGPEY